MTEKIANPSITDQQVIPDDSVNESDQDLFNVNYKEIYSDLSQHGKWIEVNGKDYGINPKEISSIEIDNKDEFLSNVFGIKNAYADADVDVGMFFVWQPDPDLTVAVAAGDVDEPPAYVPYSDGQWAYSDDNGWYFQGATPYEDVTFHYGRWVYNPYSGWVWVPGRVLDSSFVVCFV